MRSFGRLPTGHGATLQDPAALADLRFAAVWQSGL
jgi:hypothetical protein